MLELKTALLSLLKDDAEVQAAIRAVMTVKGVEEAAEWNRFLDRIVSDARFGKLGKVISDLIRHRDRPSNRPDTPASSHRGSFENAQPDTTPKTDYSSLDQ